MGFKSLQGQEIFLVSKAPSSLLLNGYPGFLLGVKVGGMWSLLVTCIQSRG